MVRSPCPMPGAICPPVARPGVIPTPRRPANGKSSSSKPGRRCAIHGRPLTYYGHDHREPWGMCWDAPAAHRILLDELATFDGWALSLSSTSLAAVLPSAPDARVAAWVKPFAAYKPGIRIAYTWEPVLFKPGRDSSSDGAPVGRDHLAERITLQKGFIGAKPPRFCRWILDLLGYRDGDTFADLFPGSGVMERVRAQGVLL